LKNSYVGDSTAEGYKACHGHCSYLLETMVMKLMRDEPAFI